MRILITGGQGFIGKNLVEHFYKDSGNLITVVDDCRYLDPDPHDPCYRPNVYFVKKPLSWFLHHEYREYDLVLHCATVNIIRAQHYFQECVDTNVYETMQLFNHVVGQQHPCTLINFSTTSIYGNAVNQPVVLKTPKDISSTYACTKLLAEQYLDHLIKTAQHNRHLMYTLRLSNVYGPYQDAANPYCGFIGRAIDCYINKEPIVLYGDGSATRDYTYVGDVCRAVEAVVSSMPAGTHYNVGTGVETIGLQVCKLLGLDYYFAENRSIDTIQRRCVDSSALLLSLIHI